MWFQLPAKKPKNQWVIHYTNKFSLWLCTANGPHENCDSHAMVVVFRGEKWVISQAFDKQHGCSFDEKIFHKTLLFSANGLFVKLSVRQNVWSPPKSTMPRCLFNYEFPCNILVSKVSLNFIWMGHCRQFLCCCFDGLCIVWYQLPWSSSATGKSSKCLQEHASW